MCLTDRRGQLRRRSFWPWDVWRSRSTKRGRWSDRVTVKWRDTALFTSDVAKSLWARKPCKAVRTIDTPYTRLGRCHGKWSRRCRRRRDKTLLHCFRCSASSITRGSRKKSFAGHGTAYRAVNSPTGWFHISWRCCSAKPVRSGMSTLLGQRYRFCDRFRLFIMTRMVWYPFILSFTPGLEIS